MSLRAQGDEAMKAGMTAATPPWPVFHLDCRSLQYTGKVRPPNAVEAFWNHLTQPWSSWTQLGDRQQLHQCLQSVPNSEAPFIHASRCPQTSPVHHNRSKDLLLRHIAILRLWPLRLLLRIFQMVWRPW